MQEGERSGESLEGWAWAEGGREQGAGQTLEYGCRKQVVGRWWAESATRSQGLGCWLEPGHGVEPPQSFGSDSTGKRQGDLIEEKLENLEGERAGA